MATNRPYRVYDKNDALFISANLLIADGQEIYEGWITSQDADGYAIPGNPDFECVGVATAFEEGSRMGVAGWRVTTYFNMLFRFSLPGVLPRHRFKNVYVLDEMTLTLTPNSSKFGIIVDVEEDFVFAYATLGQPIEVLAANVALDTSNFDRLLSPSDDTVQKALDTIDDKALFDPLDCGTF